MRISECKLLFAFGVVVDKQKVSGRVFGLLNRIYRVCA